ncbi:MAG: SpoIIE family protein phosphatase [Leptospira sp.]|nr:SpoIIE family protein phosphatase [Leptospira sp.]
MKVAPYYVLLKRLFYIFYLCLFISCNHSFLPFQANEWKSDWEMRWMPFSEIHSVFTASTESVKEYLPYNIPYISMEKNQNRILIARRKITNISNISSPSLYIRGGGQILSIYVEDKKLSEQYKIEELSNENGLKFTKLTYNTRYFPVINLDPLDEGKYLYILFYSEKNFPIGFSETPLLADQTENYKALVNRNQSFAGLGFFFLVLGVFSSYLYLRRKKKAIIAFTIFSLLSGIHFMAQVGFWGYFWYNYFHLNFYIFVITLFSIPVSGLYFFDKLFGVGRWNIIRMLWQFQLIFSIGILTLSFFEAITYTIAFVTFFWVAIPALILQVFVACAEYFSGKPRAWLLILGSMCLLLFNLHDILATMGKIDSLVRLSPWGFFLFVLSLSLYGEEIFRNSEVKYAALQKEIVTASRIQNAILPPNPPKWENFEIAVYYQPSHEVGGDFYDFQALGNKKYGILIADVVGHGLGASIIASLSKFSFFQNHTHWKNPSFLLSSMNDDLVKRSQGRFTTASYFYIDLEKMKYIVSSAGHPSFFHYKKDKGVVSEIKPKGRPLGILEDLIFMEEEHPISPGDQFLLYTDGLPEEMGPGNEEFGTDALKELFQLNAGLSPEVALKKILESFHLKVGLLGAPHDDITMLYVSVKG